MSMQRSDRLILSLRQDAHRECNRPAPARSRQQRSSHENDRRRKRMSARHLGLLLAMVIATPSRAEPLETVRVGINGIISDAPLFIAVERGYFRAQGIKANFVSIDTRSQI